MVQREFWKNIHKIQRYLDTHKQKQQHYKSQQKKLESFVTKQLKLSTKMAHYMKEKPKNEMEDENGELEDEEFEKDSDLDSEEESKSFPSNRKTYVKFSSIYKNRSISILGWIKQDIM
mgnify:CR=1 FL=1